MNTISVQEELDALDPQIAELKARLSQGSATDGDLEALLKQRARLENRLAGARIVEAREADKRDADRRATIEAEIEQRTARIESTKDVSADAARRVVELFRQLAVIYGTLAAAERQADDDARTVERLSRELGRTTSVRPPPLARMINECKQACAAAAQGMDHRVRDGAGELVFPRAWIGS